MNRISEDMDSSSTEAVPVMQVKCAGFSATVFYCTCVLVLIDSFCESIAGRSERKGSGERERAGNLCTILSRCMFEFCTERSSLIIGDNFFLLITLMENVFIKENDRTQAAKNEETVGIRVPKKPNTIKDLLARKPL